MGAKTSIEWTRGDDGTPGASWNPIRARNRETGKVGWFCIHESGGCRFCYSETINRRLGTGVDFQAQNRDKIEIFLDENILLQPLHWKRPRKIFPNSMTDWMADFVPDEWRDRMMAVMALCPQHTFLPLTKRAERMRDYLNKPDTFDCIRTAAARSQPIEIPRMKTLTETRERGWPLPNVWAGVSVEDQRRADERIPLLLETPATVRWISAEPLLGRVDLKNIGEHDYTEGNGQIKMRAHGIDALWKTTLRPRLDWVVIGGESGPRARPFEIEWARSIIRQCTAAGVASFYKQGGSSNRCPHDSKGGHFECFPPDLRVREYPAAGRA